jgi:hypothetical protein
MISCCHRSLLRNLARSLNLGVDISISCQKFQQFCQRRRSIRLGNCHRDFKQTLLRSWCPRIRHAGCAKVQTDDKDVDPAHLWSPLQWHTGPRALQIRCRLLRTLTEIAIENSAPDGK